jgi:hypothetical protein
MFLFKRETYIKRFECISINTFLGFSVNEAHLFFLFLTMKLFGTRTNLMENGTKLLTNKSKLKNAQLTDIQFYTSKSTM